MRASPALLAAAALLTPLPALADVVEVVVVNFAFFSPEGPENVTITLGDTVRWVHGSGHHTTTSVAGIPEQWSAPIDHDNPSFEHTFTNEGVWWYYCIPHGFDLGDGTAVGMAATVTVAADKTCPADWDGSGDITSDDYFAFLTDFFGEGADFNESGATDSDDYFAFLAAFFEGC